MRDVPKPPVRRPQRQILGGFAVVALSLAGASAAGLGAYVAGAMGLMVGWSMIGFGAADALVGRGRFGWLQAPVATVIVATGILGSVELL